MTSAPQPPTPTAISPAPAPSIKTPVARFSYGVTEPSIDTDPANRPPTFNASYVATDETASFDTHSTSDHSTGRVDTSSTYQAGERLYRRGEALRRNQEQRSEMLKAVSEAYGANGQALFKVS
jgi:hypothetical protein